MAEQQYLTGFSLLQQPLGEADTILTFFSIEEGKVRVVIKSAKRVTSKLVGAVQPYAEARIAVVGRSAMSTVVGSEVVTNYGQILNNQDKIHAVMVVQEFLNRSTADHEPNTQLYNLTKNFYQYLNTESLSSDQVRSAVLQFLIQGMDAIGLAPKLLNDSDEQVSFSNQEGGFVTDSVSATAISVNYKSYDLFVSMLRAEGFEKQDQDLSKLWPIILNFISYQLERDLKTTQYFS